MSQKIALLAAAVAVASANLASAIAEESGAELPGNATDADKPKRGRPPGSTNKPAEASTEAPAASTVAAPEEKIGPEALKRCQDLIKKIAEQGNQAAAREVIQKYAEKLNQVPASKAASVEADLAALDM